MSMMPGQTQPDLNALFATLSPEERDKLMRYAMENQDDSMLQTHLMTLMSLPSDQRSAAIADLTEAYEPMRDDLRGELAQNYDMLTSESPQGQVAGNNQFSVYVGANPLEHIASGINKYQAGKGVRENRDELKKLNERQAAAQQSMMESQAKALETKAYSSALRNPNVGGGQLPPTKQPWETEEEYALRMGGRASI